MNNKNLVFL